MDWLEVWEEIYDAFLLGKVGLENELEIYRKWIPIFDDKLKEHIEKGCAKSERARITADLTSDDFTNALLALFVELDSDEIVEGVKELIRERIGE